MTPKTCSRESGAKLQALGVSVESYFVYEHHEWGECKVTYECKPSYLIPDYKKATTAYLAGELGEMLPKHVSIFKTGSDWEVIYGDYKPITRGRHGEYSDTEAEARALMLIWLITEGLVTVEEINKGGK